MATKARKESSIAQDAMMNDSDEDYDAPEEESNVATRQNIKSLDKSRRTKKRVIRKSAPSAGGEEIHESDSKTEPVTQTEEASTSSLPAAKISSTSHLLDPSLFAASFAKKNPAHLNSKGKAKASSSLSQSVNLPTKKRFGLAKGRDGQPMKKLKDGRTIVRVLAKQPQKINLEADNHHPMEETLLPPSALDATEVLPNAKVRAFRKHKLGLKEGKSEPTIKSSHFKSRLEEDPLGLEDPAFMKGGELEGVGLSLSRKPSARSRPAVQRKGGRTKFTPSMSKHGQALQFARSN